jgi:NAD(P)H dehydrogenase (quinone)
MSNTINRITVILANPEYDQDNRSTTTTNLCKTFIESVQKKGIAVDLIDLYKEEEFDPIFDPEEKDTKALEFQIRLKKTQMVVIFHPVWWSLFPAILKGFLDKIFTRGFAYDNRKGITTGLLDEMQALVFAVGERPAWEHRIMYRDILKNFWNKAFFANCGIKSKFYHLGSLRTISEDDINKWHKKVEKIGSKIKCHDTLLDLI